MVENVSAISVLWLSSMTMMVPAQESCRLVTGCELYSPADLASNLSLMISVAVLLLCWPWLQMNRTFMKKRGDGQVFKLCPKAALHGQRAALGVEVM